MMAKKDDSKAAIIVVLQEDSSIEDAHDYDDVVAADILSSSSLQEGVEGRGGGCGGGGVRLGISGGSGGGGRIDISCKSMDQHEEMELELGVAVVASSAEDENASQNGIVNNENHYYHLHGSIRRGCNDDTTVDEDGRAGGMLQDDSIENAHDNHSVVADILSTSLREGGGGSGGIDTSCKKQIIDHDEMENEEVMASMDTASNGILVAQPHSPPSSSSARRLQSSNGWVQRGDANLVGTSDFDKFGTPSVLSSNGLVLAIGAPYSNGGPGQDSGSVQVYDYANGSLYQLRGPAIHGSAAGDTFGWSVSLSDNGEILAVGAPVRNGVGYVKIFKYNGSQYEEVTTKYEGDPGDMFGYSTSLSGNGKILASSAPMAKWLTGGFVKTYNVDTTTVPNSVIEFNFFQGGISPANEFGYSTSLSQNGNILAIGDRLLSAVYIYQFDGFVYKSVCDKLGEAATLSGDGTRFAVRNVTSAMVSVFSINAGNQCLQMGQNISISTTTLSPNYDPTEILMSLSNDGHVLAVANPINTQGVQVYEDKYNAKGELEYATRGDAIIANSTAVSLSDDGKVLAIGVPFRNLGNGNFEDNGSTLVYEWTSQSINPTPSPTSVSSPLQKPNSLAMSRAHDGLAFYSKSTSSSLYSPTYFRSQQARQRKSLRQHLPRRRL